MSKAEATAEPSNHAGASPETHHTPASLENPSSLIRSSCPSLNFTNFSLLIIARVINY